jgi:hypothetical protein
MRLAPGNKKKSLGGKISEKRFGSGRHKLALLVRQT